MQPAYSQSDFKVLARAENIKLYRRITRLKSVPSDRQYWTLCARQTRGQGSEIMQVTREGLITASQFFGVDWDKDGEGIIEKNREDHPKATWITGEWSDVIGKCQEFNPGLIYLDTTSFADGERAARLTVNTMFRCPPGTVLLANLMMNDPRSSKRFSSDHLFLMIKRNFSSDEIKKWDSEIINFDYSMTPYTSMGTFAFHKHS